MTKILFFTENRKWPRQIKVERIGDSNMDNGFSSIQKCDLSFTYDFRGTRIGRTIVIDMIFILFIDFIHRIFGKNKIHWVFR